MINNSLKIARKFTIASEDVYSDVEFIERISEIKQKSGNSTSIRHVIAPKNWSQIAVDIIAQKYMRRDGVPLILQKIPEDGIPAWLSRSEAAPEAGLEYRSESDVREVINRIAGAWTYYAWKGSYFNTEEDALAYYDEMRYMIIHQMGSPNSPQFFNTGIYWAYGIKGSSQGHYYVDPIDKITKKSSSAYERPQAQACFILSLEDNLIEDNGIMDLVMREARIFKFGSGVGTNFSAIRGKGEKLSSGGVSSGLMSFLKIGDASGGAIKSGGTTRRAAKMLVLNVDHPEILEYINWKVKEEDKVVSLITGSKIIKHFLDLVKNACENPECKKEDLHNVDINHKLAKAVLYGYNNHIPMKYIARILSLLSQGIEEIDWETFNTDYDGEAYNSISGQNSNNSVRLTNDFMNAVIRDEEFLLTNRIDGKEFKKMRAKELWNSICRASWTCADPGLQFHTTINDWNTCPENEIVASNPCSEFNFHNNTSCNLASINLDKFRYNDQFDFDAFVHACQLWTITLEISVYMAQFPSKEIAEQTYKFRTVGLGYANLGSLLMNFGIPYDSDKGRAFAAYLTALMHGASLEISADMADYFGPFEGYKNPVNSKGMLEVVNNHFRVIRNELCLNVDIQPIMLDRNNIDKDQLQYLEELWNRVIDKGNRYGFRNAQHTVLAPTGTIGLLMDCGTTGVEPQYAIVAWKKLAGGGYMKIINQSISIALKNLGYSNKEINSIVQYIIGSCNIDDAPIINKQSLISKGILSDEIDKINSYLPFAWSLGSAFSHYVIGDSVYERLGISKTDNLLNHLEFTQDEIKQAELYLCGHKCIEGAPHLKEEHLKIFDCANKNGEFGERFISGEGHIDMMASVQPFLSGAISKTINVPESEVIDGFSRLSIRAWKMGLKAIAFFRDGSKLSSALSTGSTNKLVAVIKSLEQTEKTSNPSNAITTNTRVVDSIPTSNLVINQNLKRGDREVMPNRRKGYTQKIKIGDTQYKFYYTIGYNNNGEIRELFITGGGKEGTAFRSLLGCFAQAVSLGLQYGIPLEKIIDHFEHSTFKPSGIIIGDPDVRFANSIIDYLMKALRHEMKQSKNEYNSNINNNSQDDFNIDVQNNIDLNFNNANNFEEIEEGKFIADSKEQNEYSEEISVKYTGEFCTQCGSYRLIKTEACSTCQDCGQNNGCG